MKMVVVGGNSRDIGKTSVVAGLINALRRYNWTAIKLTQYGHGVYAEDGEEYDGAPDGHPFAITEETDRSGKTDTSRFLVAGARRALWARVRMGTLETALPALRQAIANDEPFGSAQGRHVIIESNSILRYYQPNVYLTVLDPTRRDFKASAREFLARADACLILESDQEQAVWEESLVELIRGKPAFSIHPQRYVTSEIAAFVEERLAATETELALPG